MCYYVGFGVEQDPTQTLYWLRESARQGCREARIHYRRIHEALNAPCEDVVSIETEGDVMEFYLSILQGATYNQFYTTPFYELSGVAYCSGLLFPRGIRKMPYTISRFMAQRRISPN
jgi:TPR repeat protein